MIRRAPYITGIAIFAVMTICAKAQATVVLWNKLGSVTEVENSEVGANGTLVGTPYAFEPAQHGGGYVRTGITGYTVPRVEFPCSTLDPLRERGTIELWINPKVPQPVPFQYGVFPLLGSTNIPDASKRGNVYLWWGDGVTGLGLFGGVTFGGPIAQTPFEPTQFVATPGQPFHVAIAWDIDGIAGSADTVRVYRDGSVVGATATAWDPAGSVVQDRFYLGAGVDAQGFDKYIVDNLVVWDYAKTDFSGRFTEDPRTVEVVIDVRPFSSGNRINPNSPIPFPVAMLGSETVDVTLVDVTTLAFGPGGAPPAIDLTDPIVYWLALQDVNDDGETDLVATFLYSETGLPMGESEACLTGEIDGLPFEGCDTVLVTIPPGCGLSVELALLLPPLMWLLRRARRRA